MDDHNREQLQAYLDAAEAGLTLKDDSQVIQTYRP